MASIEPVAPGDIQRALTILAGGDEHTPAAQKVSRFEAYLFGPDARPCTLWWAKTFVGPQAVVLIVHALGRVGLLFHGPLRCWHTQLLAELLEKAAGEALARGMCFVQAMLSRQSLPDQDAYDRAGFTHLAELAYLHRRLDALPSLGHAETLLYTPFSQDQEALLAEVIEDTYIDSLDCPGLRGLRPMAEVLVSHRTSGVYTPQFWWIPREKAPQGGQEPAGEPVGCVLLNATSWSGGAVEVVYVGIRPRFRHRGYCKEILLHALQKAAQAGKRGVYLAVDAINTPATSLYAGLGFRELDRRQVLIKAAK